MIEINLLPEESRVKIKERVSEQPTVKSGPGFNQEMLFIYALPAVLAFFVLAHLYFGILSIAKAGKLTTLNKKWIELAPQKKIFDEFNQAYSAASLDAGLTQLLLKQRVLWGEKLNKLSLELPSGVWFNDIAFSKQSIIIQGSVISLKMDELNLINQLLDSLKADQEFFKDFSSFELSNVQKRSIGSYDISDFVLQGTLRTK
ncbi:MAG: hypothetical protein COV71_00135 [Candidatus Omnitrophica bacterium CG11_big_fil_rev_8_21_14_0_20_41_12]|nr:MAG: hypothetical protein COV71_00135 [Candidatus Omnitrophica bacterium CG11_big_fil_rev_8_21_14_0_20_41_12]